MRNYEKKIQILEFINKTLSIYITVIYYDLYPDIIRLIIEQFVAVSKWQF